MTDIIERLRHTAGHLINGQVEDGAVETGMLCEAADEIERLRAQVERMDQALRTMANHSMAKAGL